MVTRRQGVGGGVRRGNMRYKPPVIKVTGYNVQHKENSRYYNNFVWIQMVTDIVVIALSKNTNVKSLCTPGTNILLHANYNFN